MVISLITLFPKIFSPVLDSSIIGRAQKKHAVDIRYIDIRDYAVDSHGTVDDKPYGGGTGMVLRVDVVHEAIRAARSSVPKGTKTYCILLDPTGTPFTQEKATSCIQYDNLILVCGHYEGIDARINAYVDEKISIGPYVLTGGEIPAMVICDAVVRLLPGVLPPEATRYESFSDVYHHEPPSYTRPKEYDGKKVPDILLSGDHANIEAWKKDRAEHSLE